MRLLEITNYVRSSLSYYTLRKRSSTSQTTKKTHNIERD